MYDDDVFKPEPPANPFQEKKPVNMEMNQHALKFITYILVLVIVAILLSLGTGICWALIKLFFG